MPTLYRQLKKLPWTAIPATSAVSTGHGRRARRTIKAALAPAWTGFEGAAQVAQLRRTVTKNGKEDRRGRLPHHQRPRRRPGHPGGLGPRPPGDRKPPSPGQGRDLSRGQIAGQDGKRAPCDGLAAQPGHHRAPPGRPCQHRRSRPPARPRPATDAEAASGRMSEFAVFLPPLVIPVSQLACRLRASGSLLMQGSPQAGRRPSKARQPGIRNPKRAGRPSA
jgi:hypothetical protein